MELWIRSQNLEQLVKPNYIEIQDHYSYKDVQEKYLLSNGSFEYRNVSKKDKYIKSVIMCNDEIYIGTYKTKERALEVLTEIHQRLIDLQTIEIEPDFCKITKRCFDIVYEMPKE